MKRNATDTYLESLPEEEREEALRRLNILHDKLQAKIDEIEKEDHDQEDNRQR